MKVTMNKFTSSSVIAANNNTCATTPRHIWMHQVVTLANVSMDDANAYCGRDRLNRWASAGEPVWMAAQSLAIMVKDGKCNERADREANYLAGIFRSIPCEKRGAE